MLYLQLFLTFFKIGLFGFGGGLAILSLIQHEVETYGWMTQEQFVDIVAVSQVTPGPIGINCATYVGFTATGSVWGSVLATLAIILPSLLIMGALCKLYFVISARFRQNVYFERTMHMLRLAVLGLIAAAALALMTPVSFIDWKSWAIFVAAALLTILPQFCSGKKDDSSAWKKILQFLSHPILLIALAGLVGFWIYA